MFSSTSYQGVNAIEILEDLYGHKCEKIVDLTTQILEFHFDYQEEDFFDSEGEPRDMVSNRMANSHV